MDMREGAGPSGQGGPGADGLSAGTGRAGGLLIGGLALALLWSFPYAEQTRNANERPRLLQAASLVERGSWRIDGLGLDPGPDVARAPDGALYPNKPPGTTVVAAAGYAVARELAGETGRPTLRAATWWGRLLAGVAPTVILCALLWRSLMPAFGGRAAALAIVLYALGTPAAAYAHLLYGHQLAACLLWAGILLLVRARTEPRPWGALAGGALAGAAVLVEYTAAFAGLALAGLVLALARAGRWGHAGAAAAGAAAPIGLLLAYHAAVFGGPLKTGYHHSATAAFAAKHAEGLLGLVAPNWQALHAHVLSLASGLCGWAPLWPVAAAGLVGLARGTGPKGQVFGARVELGALAAVLLACVSLNFEGGWRVGPRYLVVVLPALALGWAWLASRALARPPRGWAAMLGLFAAAALGSWSLAINGLAANLWPHFDLTNVREPVPEVLLPLVADGMAPYSLGGWLGWPGSVPWLVLATIAAAAWLAAPRRLGRGRAAVLAGALAGLGLVAATRLMTPHPRAGANLQYIERVWEPPRTGAAASAVLGR